MKNSLSAGEVSEVLRSGKRVVCDAFVLLYTERKTGPPMRMSVVVPKKKIKKAVERNRVRRVVKGVFKDVRFPITEFVVIYNGPKDVQYSDAREEVKKLAKKIA